MSTSSTKTNCRQIHPTQARSILLRRLPLCPQLRHLRIKSSTIRSLTTGKSKTRTRRYKIHLSRLFLHPKQRRRHGAQDARGPLSQRDEQRLRCPNREPEHRRSPHLYQQHQQDQRRLRSRHGQTNRSYHRAEARTHMPVCYSSIQHRKCPTGLAHCCICRRRSHLAANPRNRTRRTIPSVLVALCNKPRTRQGGLQRSHPGRETKLSSHIYYMYNS